MRSSKPQLQDEYGVVLMGILCIEWIWVELYGKREEKNTHSGKFSSNGTISVLFFYFDQRLYFGHNLVISYPI